MPEGLQPSPAWDPKATWRPGGSLLPPAASQAAHPLAPASSNAGASALTRPPSYRVDGQESQLVVGPSVLGGDVLGLQVPAGERGDQVSGWQDPRKSRARMAPAQRKLCWTWRERGCSERVRGSHGLLWPLRLADQPPAELTPPSSRPLNAQARKALAFAPDTSLTEGQHRPSGLGPGHLGGP